MNAHIEPQIIEHAGKPMFVVLPYEDFLELTKEDDDEGVTLPAEVVDIAMDEGKSLIRAWREYLGLTQEQVATKIEVSRAAYSQMEAADAKPRRATLLKIANALGVNVRQLTD